MCALFVEVWELKLYFYPSAGGFEKKKKYPIKWATVIILLTTVYNYFVATLIYLFFVRIAVSGGKRFYEIFFFTFVHTTPIDTSYPTLIPSG